MSDQTPSNLFLFEREEFSDLNWMPLALRYRLDVCGIKLSLAAWQALPFPERLALLDSPYESEAERVAWALRLGFALSARGLAAPESLTPWVEVREIPSDIQEKLVQTGFDHKVEWQNLSPIQRYALCKLARGRQSGRYFPSAVLEFSNHQEF